MGFFNIQSGGGVGVMPISIITVVVIAPMLMEFSTGMKIDVFYTMVTKKFVSSLPLRN